MVQISHLDIDYVITSGGNDTGVCELRLADRFVSNHQPCVIAVRNELTIEEKELFAERVANTCFDAAGDYLPAYLNPMFDITLLQMTTEIPVFTLEGKLTPEDGAADECVRLLDIEKTYRLCRMIGLPDHVHNDKFTALVSELRELVREKVDFWKEKSIHGTFERSTD